MGAIRSFIINLFMLCVRAIVQSYTYITLPLYHLAQNPKERLRRSQVIRSRQLDPSDPYSPYVRTGPVPDHPLTVCKTVLECFELMKKIHDMNRPVVGYRTIIDDRVVLDPKGQPVRMDGKVVRKLRLTDYKWLTYQQVFDQCELIGKGLVTNGFTKHKRCAIFTDTCVENLLFMIASQGIGLVGVGVFSNLGDEGIIHAINETESESIFTSYDLLDRVLNLSSKCPTLNTVIYVESKVKSHRNFITYNNKIPNKLRLISFSKLTEDGKSFIGELKLDPFDFNDVAVIGYTSGTNGPPKGVSLTIAQIREAALTLLPACEKFMAHPERHTYIAYLPQVHVLEASMELVTFLGGARIGIGNPLTLNESAPGLADGVICDLKLLKPTVMAAVPLVLDRMRKEMYLKLRKRTPFSTDIFNYLIKYKIEWTQKGYNCPIVNALVCYRVKEQFGGRLEQLVIGGAPLSPQLQALIKASLNVKLIQGYGATELSGAVLAMDDDDLSYGRCGAPLANIKIRLEDWPEGGYTALDQPNPRGELIVSGCGISKEYYNNKELTAQSYIEGENGVRWFRTGDICEVFPDGTFRIIDRKKDLIKLSNGEYFSLGKIESCLKNNQYVDNICVIGNDAYFVALVVPNHKSLESLAKRLCLHKLLTFSELCYDSVVVETIYKSIIETGLENNLHRRELPLKIRLCDEEWSPDNGLLTAALKLKRPIIAAKYKLAIDIMFGLV